MSLHEHMNLLEDQKRAAWAKTSPVSGQSKSWEFRKDCLGNLLRYADYGKRNSPFGWELNFIKPRHMGGATQPENMQALHWRANAAKVEAVPPGLLSNVNAVTAEAA